MTKSEINIKPAKRYKRIAAAILDTLLAIIAIGSLSLPLYFIYFNNVNPPTPSTSLGLVLISMLTGALATLVCLIYEVLLPFVWSGQSFGMRVMRIKIVDEKGQLLKLRQLVIRAITVVFTFITTAGVSLIAEIFIVALSTDHRSFNDTVSRIYVVDYVRKPLKLSDEKEG